MSLTFLPSSFVGFLAVNSFIGCAEWTYAIFNILDKPEGKSTLLFSGLFAYRTLDTSLCLFSIILGNGSCGHWKPPAKNKTSHLAVLMNHCK